MVTTITKTLLEKHILCINNEEENITKPWRSIVILQHVALLGPGIRSSSYNICRSWDLASDRHLTTSVAPGTWHQIVILHVALLGPGIRSSSYNICRSWDLASDRHLTCGAPGTWHQATKIRNRLLFPKCGGCDGTFTTNNQVISNHLNKVFFNIGKQLQSRIPNYGDDYEKYLPQRINKTFCHPCILRR